MGCGSSRADRTTYRPVTIDSFKINEIVGKGTFGKVCIVERKSDHKLFALKYSNKEKALHDKAVGHIIQERNMLEELRHTFVCGLRYSFQDEEYLYMILDLMRGGDLRFHIKARPLTENEIRLIIAEISCALRYLHALSIVHRDIKPDNILMDEAGHAYLTDFNVAIRFVEGKPLKSVAGTEPYMAPEIITGAGYYSAIDWWSLGVMTFELVCGERPFRSKMRREFIKRAKYKFPESAVGLADSCRSLISGFLQLDPRKRLGYGPEGLAALHNHLFFSGLSWTKVECKAVQPVFVPSRVEANYKTDANSEDLLQFVSRKRRPFPEKSLIGSVFQDFTYFDYTLFRERTVPIYFSAGSLRSMQMDSSEVEGHDRVNTSFETSNSSGMSKWMSLSSQMSVKRRNSKPSQFARRRHSTVSHRQRDVPPAAAGAASQEDQPQAAQSPPSAQSPASPPSGITISNPMGTGNVGGATPISNASGHYAAPQQAFAGHGVHLSPLSHAMNSGKSSENLGSASSVKRRHTINAKALGAVLANALGAPMPPTGSRAADLNKIPTNSASPSPAIPAASVPGAGTLSVMHESGNNGVMSSSHGPVPVVLVGKNEDHEKFGTAIIHRSNASIYPQDTTDSGKQMRHGGRESTSMRPSVTTQAPNSLAVGAEIERRRSIAGSISGSALGSRVGLDAHFNPHLIAELPQRTTTRRRHSFNAPIMPEDPNAAQMADESSSKPEPTSSAQSLQPPGAIQPLHGLAIAVSSDSGSGSGKISGKSSSILAGSQARIHPEDHYQSKDSALSARQRGHAR